MRFLSPFVVLVLFALFIQATCQRTNILAPNEEKIYEADNETQSNFEWSDKVDSDAEDSDLATLAAEQLASEEPNVISRGQGSTTTRSRLQSLLAVDPVPSLDSDAKGNSNPTNGNSGKGFATRAPLDLSIAGMESKFGSQKMGLDELRRPNNGNGNGNPTFSTRAPQDLTQSERVRSRIPIMNSEAKMAADAADDSCVYSGTRYAVAKITTPADTNIAGYVHFEHTACSNITITVNITGWTATQALIKHGLHVHKYGDLTNGCLSLLTHWNPHNMTHGAPSATIRHVGDFGNIEIDSETLTTYTVFTDWKATLFGDDSIIGRGIVVHVKTDDLGLGGDAESLLTGNAGARLGCGVIGWTSA